MSYKVVMGAEKYLTYIIGGGIIFVVLFWSSASFCSPLIVGWWSSGLQNLRVDSQRRKQKMRMTNWTSKMMKNMERPCAGRAGSIMALMNSGFAVTSVRSGSMGNAWRSPLLGRSISSNTSAHHAVTRELAPDIS